jgi:hypothetical protein
VIWSEPGSRGRPGSRPYIAVYWWSRCRVTRRGRGTDRDPVVLDSVWSRLENRAATHDFHLLRSLKVSRLFSRGRQVVIGPQGVGVLTPRHARRRLVATRSPIRKSASLCDRYVVLPGDYGLGLVAYKVMNAYPAREHLDLRPATFIDGEPAGALDGGAHVATVGTPVATVLRDPQAARLTPAASGRRCRRSQPGPPLATMTPREGEGKDKVRRRRTRSVLLDYQLPAVDFGALGLPRRSRRSRHGHPSLGCVEFAPVRYCGLPG